MVDEAVPARRDQAGGSGGAFDPVRRPARRPAPRRPRFTWSSTAGRCSSTARLPAAAAAPVVRPAFRMAESPLSGATDGAGCGSGVATVAVASMTSPRPGARRRRLPLLAEVRVNVAALMSPIDATMTTTFSSLSARTPGSQTATANMIATTTAICTCRLLLTIRKMPRGPSAKIAMRNRTAAAPIRSPPWATWMDRSARTAARASSATWSTQNGIHRPDRHHCADVEEAGEFPASLVIDHIESGNCSLGPVRSRGCL